MSRFDNEIRVHPSVLDRLIDYEPEYSREAPASRVKNLRILKQSVRRDLEWLLNTRATAVVPPELKEVWSSIVVYGLPDISALSGRSPADKAKLRRAVERVLETFEPRLEGVVVTVDPEPGPGLSLKFRIDGRLKVDPAPEPVSFDTLLQIGSGEFRVKGE
ncbi:MAG TPA: type VI secretion system baseplate subunit TssE [Thermoanaerobaculia bacterium]|nr:type VI secretion system baseplate subunit TssE [Thermoanaerobaculia bacterium]HRY46040.1 type VI secretion system baseplate subunit TssE [Thermoanaerobaculia bacterium]